MLPLNAPQTLVLTDPHSATRTGLAPLQLGGHAAKAALAELPEGVKVDSVIFGCVRGLSLPHAWNRSLTLFPS